MRNQKHNLKYIYQIKTMPNLNKRIVDLPLILANDISSLDVLPIVNVEADVTNKVTIGELANYFDSNDTFLTGVTYNNEEDNLTLSLNNGTTLSAEIPRYNRWFIPSGRTYTIENNFQSFVYGDLIVEGTLDLEPEGQLIVLNGDIILSGGTIIGSGTTYSIDIPDFDTKISAVTYNTLTDTLTITSNDATSFSQLIPRYNRWHIPSGQTYVVENNFQSFIYGDLIVEGTLDMQPDGQLVVVNGDIILSGGSIVGSGTTYLIGLPEFNTFVTGGTYDTLTKSIDFSGNFGFTPFSVDLSSIVTDDITVTGGTYDSTTGVATFYNNSGGTFQVSGFLTGYTNFYTTGATLVGTTLEFDRTDQLNAYSVDLSPLKFTGNTISECISDIYVSNLHACSPLNINPGDEGNVNFGSTNQVSIELPSGKVVTQDLQIVNGANSGYVLTSDVSGNASWQAPFNTNLYNSDGTLTGSRTVTMNGNNLSFQSNGSAANIISFYGYGNTSSSRTYFEIAQRKNGSFSSSVFFSTFSPDYTASLWGSYFAGSSMLSSYHENAGGGNGNLYFDLSHYTGTLTNKHFAWHAAPVLTARGLSTEMMRLEVISDGNGYLGLGTKGIPQQRLHVSGNTRVDGNLYVNGNSVFSGQTTDVVKIYGSGTTTPIFTIQGSSGELFSVTDSLIGSLFSVNDISGLPVLEAFSDNTILMGSYQAPSLNTTSKKTANAGTTTIYSIPTSAYTGAFFDYTINDGSNMRAGNIMSIWSGTSVNFTETTTTDFGNTSGLTFNMSVSSGNAILEASAVTSNWVVKTIVRSI